MPRRVEGTLLVIEEFTDASGNAWREGDRAPLARRGVREAAAEHPHRFRVELETLPFDPEEDWFQTIVADYEARYRELKGRRDGEEERRQAALRQELKEQEEGQPDLERRYRKQQKEQAEREKRAREERERRQLENEMEFGYQGFSH
jgi:hypothetical protein